MKRRLQELLNHTAEVIEKSGASELHVDLNSLSTLQEGDPHLALEDKPSEVLDTVLEDTDEKQRY
jgi:hypothetical protein